MLEGYPLISRFTVPFADIDMLRHVNNVAYIRWAEMMRAEYFARVMAESIDGAHGMIQVTSNFTYERQLHYRERIAIGVRVARLGGKSFDFDYAIASEDAAQRAAHGVTTVVAFDFARQLSIAIPPAWRAAIAAFEGGPPVEFR